MSQPTPSPWVQRFSLLIRQGGHVLDLAAGVGRHTRILLDMGFAVTAVDRDIEALHGLAGGKCALYAIDLESGAPEAALRPLGAGFDGIIVANYLHRPLLRPLASMLGPGGVLIYETFMAGNERLGRPRNPDFLLRPGELLEAFAMLTTVAFEQGEVAQPRPAVVQRIAAINGPVCRLPEAADLDNQPASD